jgi:hypothetical protein
VQWRLGGARGAPWQGAPWQLETFTDRRSAVKFAGLVDAAEHAWPEGWVKGYGFAPPPAPEPDRGADQLLADFGAAYVRRLTGAGPDTQSRYLVQVERLAGWLRDVERSRDRAF